MDDTQAARSSKPASIAPHPADGAAVQIVMLRKGQRASSSLAAGSLLAVCGSRAPQPDSAAGGALANGAGWNGGRRPQCRRKSRRRFNARLIQTARRLPGLCRIEMASSEGLRTCSNPGFAATFRQQGGEGPGEDSPCPILPPLSGHICRLNRRWQGIMVHEDIPGPLLRNK